MKAAVNPLDNMITNGEQLDAVGKKGKFMMKDLGLILDNAMKMKKLKDCMMKSQTPETLVKAIISKLMIALTRHRSQRF